MGQPVDVRQMEAEQMVEQRLVIGVELVAVPPEPVAPFGGIEFVPRLTDRVGRHVAGALPLLQEAPGRPHPLPGVIVLDMAYPDLQIGVDPRARSEEHTSELQSQSNLVCRLLLEKKNTCVMSRPAQSLHSESYTSHAYLTPFVTHVTLADFSNHTI